MARAPKKVSAQRIAEDRIRRAAERGEIALDLSALDLLEVPGAVGRLAKLQSLDLSKNTLKGLPETLGQLSQLQSLNLSLNKLTSLPASVCQLSRLRALSLFGNELAALPESIGRLAQLRTLYVSGNWLSGLPESIGGLTRLQELELSRNQLTVLPETIGQLANLRRIDLSRNGLVGLPASLGLLGELRELILMENRLTALPVGLRRLEKLTALYLHGNPDLEIPPEILGPEWIEVDAQRGAPAKPGRILDYYFRTREAHRPLNEAKLILVGRGGVGKTCLVRRLVRDAFDPRQPQTDGIEITDWMIRAARGDKLRLHIWDFGGQEIMHATHQFFLTRRSLYLLVLSGREGSEEDDADYWLRMIESFGADSPVVVVLNKIQEWSFDVNRRALQGKYPAIRGFIKTDCRDRTGIDELGKIIRDETDRLENVRVKFPAKWFTIKDELSVSRRNYLRYEEYREFCRGLGEHDHGHQDLLAGYLHVLGIVLNYKDDARLRDHHVLNPHWVTRGVYKLLNAPLLKERMGVLELSDAEGLLDPVAYPREMHRFLLDLMKKFELCITFPGDDERYLLPELLDRQEPAEAAEYRPEECLNFQYNYPVVPEGLLPRFIVRTHVLSEGQPRWRTGVILRFEGSRALVKADTAEKRVLISILGPTRSGRRDLLAVIRSDFEHIHRDIPKLHPQPMVPVPGHPDVVLDYHELRVMEAAGEIELTRVLAGRVERLGIPALLDGVDFQDERSRRHERSSAKLETGAGRSLRLFYSYSHKDEDLRNQLETHLKLLCRRGVIETWHDRLIGPGQEWTEPISENLEGADIVLLLVSADFIASDYCYDIEMRRALERHEAAEARVIPVIVRDVDWSAAPFRKLQALPKEGRAVTLWPDRDSAWRDVAVGIKAAAEELRKTKSLSRSGG